MNANSLDAGVFIKPVAGLPPAENPGVERIGEPIDRDGYDTAVLVALTGEETGAPTSRQHEVKLQDSRDGAAGWRDLPGTITIETSTGVTRSNYNIANAHRFIRAVERAFLGGGTSPTLHTAAVVVLGGPDELPAK
jgi:hypothetical protein